MWRDIKVIDTVLLGNADEVLMDPRMQRRHSVILITLVTKSASRDVRFGAL